VNQEETQIIKMEKEASEIERKLKILTYRGECGASVEGETNIERETDRPN
jgi:hypothetical protein